VNLRRWWFQIGGPNALSIWSWLITLPMAMGVSLTFEPEASDRDRLLWTGYVLAVQVLLGGLMWIAARTLLPREVGRSRPVVAMSVFVGLGIVRVVAMDLGGSSFNAVESSLATRLAINVLAGPIILAVIAVVVDSYRRHAAVMQRLQQAQASLEAVRTVAVETRAVDERELIQQVFDEVSEALTSRNVDPAQIKSAARDLVRTRSHEIERDDSIPIPEAAVVKRPVQDLRALSGRMVLPRAWATALTIEMLTLPVVASVHGWVAGIVHAVTATIVIAGALLAGHVIWRWLPQWMRGGVGVVVVGFVTGLLAVSVVLPVVRLVYPDYPVYLASGTALVLVFVVGFSLASAIGSTLRANEERQSALVSEAAGQVQELRMRIAERRRKVAAFLHGPIQAELLVASASDVPVDQVMASLEDRFAQFGREVPKSTAIERINAVILAWSAALTITSEFDDAALARADAHPGCAQVIVDALSEGFANALRHATSSNVHVMLGCEGEDSVELRVRTEGAVASTRSGDGIGLRHLQESARTVELVPAEQSTELVVRV
jgi:hypothetical protein